MSDLVVKLIYRVERNYLPADGDYWRPWSATDYRTRDEALAAKGRITANYSVAEDHLRVVRVTVEVVE